MKVLENAAKGQFILKDILYHVTSSCLAAEYRDKELILYPEVNAKTEDTHVEYEMRSVYLYHNNGFNTHASGFNELKGRKFIWKEEYNMDDEEAGNLCVQEHEAVREGTIEILNAEEGEITIKWSGKADVGWSKKYGSKVPFETIFTAKIPDTIHYVLDAFKSTKMIIDDNTQLELLNLEEFNREVMRVSGTRIWDSFNTILKFKLICENAEYFGDVRFTNGKNNFELKIDEGCPKKVLFKGVDYNLRVNYEMFSFGIG